MKINVQHIIVFSAWTIFALLLHSVIFTNLSSVVIWTDLLFYLVIILGLKFNFRPAIISTCLLGYIADAVSFVPYGTTLLSYVLVLFFIRLVKANIYFESKWTLFIWIAVFSIMKQLIQGVTLAISMNRFDLHMDVAGLILLQSVWDALLGLFMLNLLNKLLFTDWVFVFSRKGLKG